MMSSANPSTNATDSPSDSGRASTGSNTTAYPPQRHAGKVGYGPAYHTGPSLGDKIKGYEEELKGHLTHNHALTEHGRELVSGEMKRKEHEQEMNDSGPFAHPEQNEKKSGAKEQTATVAAAGNKTGEAQRKGEAANKVKHVG